jgi:hypothetical protein
LCRPPPGPAYLSVTVYSNYSTYQTGYFFDSSTSATKYVFREYDGISPSDYTTSSFDMLTATMGPGTCTFPALTGPPTMASTVTHGTNLSVTVPVSSTTSYVNVQITSITGGLAGFKNTTFTAGASPTVTVSVPISSAAGAGAYYPHIYVSDNVSLSAEYRLQGTADYFVQQSDGSFQNAFVDSGIALPTVTVN